MPTSELPDLPAGTVVVVPFPSSDRLAEKRRPAVVVSGEAVARAGYVWIVMITSARNTPEAGDVRIEAGAPAGLAVASVVRTTKIACIEPARILRRLGTLGPDAAAAVRASLHDMIGHT